MISVCDSKQLLIVKEIFNVKDSWEDIKSFDDVIKYLGESDEEVIEYRKLIKANITSRSLSFKMLACWVKALNEKHILDWGDPNESKYYIWWYMEPFRFLSVHHSCVFFCVPSALCFKNRDIATHAHQNKEFFEIYKNYMN
jgi:hypothetical protein